MIYQLKSVNYSNMFLFCTNKIYSDIMNGMNALRRKRSLYDVRIIVGGHDVTAHKCVLASVSDYFKSLLTGPFKTDASIVEVDFTSVALDFESTEAVIEYLYTGAIKIDEDNLEAILKLASFLMMKQLQELCVRFMEESTDLTSYLRYFQLSVDYMVPGAEEVASKVVKSRFHDLFVFGDSTKNVSPCHLQKLFEDYDIFENCTVIDTFSFIIDWVTIGNTDDHCKLGLKILEAQFEEDPCCEEERERNEELQSDEEAGSDNELKFKQKELKHPDVNSDQDPKPDFSPLSHTETGENCSPQSADIDKAKPCEFLMFNEIDEFHREPQIIEEVPYTLETEPKSDAQDEQLSDTGQSSSRKIMGLNIPPAVGIIMSKLESSTGLSEFTGKCKELIEKKFGTESNASTSNRSESDLPESDVDQVLIAVAPKKRLKDFLADSKRGYKREMSLDEAIFDICVYVPRSQSWFYHSEGTNDGIFKQIGKKNSQWPINFCTNDKLCCVSPDQKRLYMYPLTRDKDGVSTNWSSVSYANLIRESIDSEFDAHHDVRVCCYDGESVYLVIKMKSSNEEGEDPKAAFNCYRLSNESTWEYMFEIHADDDFDIYKSNTFDVHISLDKKVMLIAVQGDQLHVFRISLEGHIRGYDKHILGDEDLENENSELNSFRGPHFWIIRNGARLSFVDEVVAENSKAIIYRNLMVKGEVYEMYIDNYERRTISHLSTNRLQLDGSSKLFQSVGTGSSAWLYLSDGLFQTSLVEILISKQSGLLDFKSHISPPFQSVTILAAGVVKRDILANLKPLHEFLLE